VKHLSLHRVIPSSERGSTCGLAATITANYDGRAQAPARESARAARQGPFCAGRPDSSWIRCGTVGSRLTLTPSTDWALVLSRTPPADQSDWHGPAGLGRHVGKLASKAGSGAPGPRRLPEQQFDSPGLRPLSKRVEGLARAVAPSNLLGRWLQPRSQCGLAVVPSSTIHQRPSGPVSAASAPISLVAGRGGRRVRASFQHGEAGVLSGGSRCSAGPPLQ